jgi:hypothetical protein
VHFKGETLKNHRLSRIGNLTFGEGVQVAARHEITSDLFVPTAKAKAEIVCFDASVLKVFIRLNETSVSEMQAKQQAQAESKAQQKS